MMTEKKSDHKGHSVFYRVIGQGKPVMLIHGFGEDGNIWESQIASLKNKFQLIIPDLPGSGKSGMIDDMSVEGMAKDIKSILDKETVTVCTVIGHSMGGYISLAFAEKYPELLNAFGLFHSTSYADSEEKKSNRRKGIEFMNKNGAFEFLKTITPNLFSAISMNQMKPVINEFINSLNGFSSEALIAYYEGMIQRPDRSAVLEKAQIPVLFVMGQYDNAIPLNDVLKQCHLPERSFIHILAKSGHMGMMEEANKSNNILDNFLNSI